MHTHTRVYIHKHMHWSAHTLGSQELCCLQATSTKVQLEEPQGCRHPRWGGVQLPGAGTEPAPGRPAYLQSHPDSGQHQDTQYESWQWSIIYSALETRNLEPDQRLVEMNIYM